MAGAEPTERKRALRRLIRARWAAVSAGDRRLASDAICGRLQAVLPEGPVLLYAALSDEVDLGPLLLHCARLGSLVLPRLVDGGIVLHRVHDLAAELAPGPHGILEPLPSAPEVLPVELTAVVVPGRAFDSAGGRLGRGGGHYDRLLPHLSATALRIGVALELALVEAVPIEPHDVRMDLVITERRLLRTALEGA